MKAPLSSPMLTGTPTAPNQATGDSSTRLATTAFVQAAIGDRRTVIETYNNGLSWYRKWSDGWVEQGGYNTGVNISVTLLIPFINTNYTIVGVGVSATNLDGTYSIYGKTATLFYIRKVQANNVEGCSWYACGYYI